MKDIIMVQSAWVIKCFVIGGNITCEVLDSVSRKFTYIKQMIRAETFSRTFSAVIIGCKVIIFPQHSSSEDKKCLIYDVYQICLQLIY